MPNLHLFLDLESIGQSVFKSPILNWSYIIVDWDRFTTDPYTFEELLDNMQFDKFDLQYQLSIGCSYSKKDLQFWLDLGDIAKETLKPTTSDVSPSTALNNLLTYTKKYTKISRWWSRANCFDPIFLQRIGEDLSNMEEVNRCIPYWLVRDTRTYIDTRFNFQNKKNAICPIDDEKHWNSIFKMHNSSHDVAADILRIQRIEKILNS